ncbi:uncharacterized protein [Epargyreus clarus]|uniref:uncharacterized protein n=1 Tax=Epargyreus clarus TaxID=520877 RepID=UPI003C2B155E
MISYLAQTLNLLASLFQKFLSFTSFVGQLIVIFISSLTTVVFNAILNIFMFFRIVYEDNVSIFTEDVPSVATEIFDNIFHLWHHLLDGVMTVYLEINYKYNILIGAIKWSVDSVLTVCGEVLLLWKKTLIFFGQSLWLALTFVPVHLPYILKTFFRYISDCIIDSVIDTYMSLLNFTNFLSDVPLESFIGILLAIIIVRLCIYFRESVQSQVINVYWILIRKVLYLYYVLYNYFTDSEERMIARIASGQQVARRNVDLSSADVDDAGNVADALCVICQERQKCVLTLPCRHVCLCTECCVRLYGYQRTCPICRTFIYHSVTVYL